MNNLSKKGECNNCCSHEKSKTAIELCESWCKKNHDCKKTCDNEIPSEVGN